MREIWNVFLVATKLGLTSFGGPVAHLGYFYEEYVRRRRWLDERRYADLTALCQFLPGPASSQVGIGVGMMRAGFAGGVAAWLGFTWPSFLLMAGFAFGLDRWAEAFGVASGAGWLHGLKLVAVAVVAQAVWSMGRQLAADRLRATLAVGAAALVSFWPTAAAQVVAIAAGGVAGVLLLGRTIRTEASPEGGRQDGRYVRQDERRQDGGEKIVHAAEKTPDETVFGRGLPSRTAGAACLAAAVLLLAALPSVRAVWPSHGLALFDGFYRAGALVFGGGHVVLPLLEKEAVAAGWVEPDRFLAGYGAAQALPGPLFTFAAFIGAEAGGWSGAFVATAGIFLPGFLLVAGALPFWEALRGMPRVRAVLAGVNASVVGVLLAALYDPVWTSAVRSPTDFALAAGLFALSAFWRLPAWAAALVGACAGAIVRGG